LDTATGCAIQSTLPARVGYTSLDLTTRFLRPVTVASGALRCEAATARPGAGGLVVAAARAGEHQRVGVGVGWELAADGLDHQGASGISWMPAWGLKPLPNRPAW
jgi:acyl-coenzyme A thioesterase PaaI-like protein